MKNLISLLAGLLITATTFAQNAARPSAADLKKLVASKRCILTGIIKDGRNFPLKGVKTFIYMPDSSIIASGFTDADGWFETNSVLPGTYTVKVWYPSQIGTIITGVKLKPGNNPVTIKAAPPAEDNTMQYADVAPQPVVKKKNK